jgi:RNAse (barnase) inhibitor barstar
MQIIELDASDWRREEHFYEALLPRLGAPAWHGRNLNAVEDSIFSGDINKVEPPFQIKVVGVEHLSSKMKNFLAKVQCVFHQGRAETGRRAFVAFDAPLLP